MMKGNPWSKRKKWAIAAIALAALAIIAGGVYLALHFCGTAEVYNGYLICQNCGMQGMCMSSKLDLTAHPEQYTLKCARMPECITSGYGIAIAQANGKYKYCPFDEKGSELALNNIIYTTKKTDNLHVEVKGTMKGNTLAVESITEK